MQYQDFTLRGHDTRKGCDVNLVGDKHNRPGQISGGDPSPKRPGLFALTLGGLKKGIQQR
jgi:hypothetical protein